MNGGRASGARSHGNDPARPGLIQQRKHLLAFDAWETFQEVLDGIAGLQVVEEALYRNTCPGKHDLPAKDLRASRHDITFLKLRHKGTLTSQTSEREFRTPIAQCRNEQRQETRETLAGIRPLGLPDAAPGPPDLQARLDHRVVPRPETARQA